MIPKAPSGKKLNHKFQNQSKTKILYNLNFLKNGNEYTCAIKKQKWAAYKEPRECNVSPRVVIAFRSNSGRCDVFDNIIARCGRQSPHLSSETH